ncbi:DUF4304 domain-containing protein [Roseimicrobium sp. ORNL1]|uniref:DUF4304 domain-containing protein n=1 Tax=Roseimicrobium sp. ORNL1 TaxID=2711231 RepID=UPI0013E190EF|nr:DUF4304 domain-containing protein [Roseimicrobium sp. ORNL1]QIF03327.1 hypothetical protein G5S37_17960 [Roseimicrobium sp. ORNL1]
MVASPAKLMNKAIKAELIPALSAAGFAGKHPRFQRFSGGRIHFLSINQNKMGTAFFLEFGHHPRGEKLTAWGEVVPEEKLMLEHVLFTERARLQARKNGYNSMEEDWFSFGAFGPDLAEYSALASSVAGMLPQIEDWFAHQTEGPNVSLNGP